MHEVHGALHGAGEAIDHGLAHRGFNSAGPNAIGIVAFPQSRLVRAAMGWEYVHSWTVVARI